MAFKLCVDAIQQNNFAAFKKNVNSSALSTKDDQGQTLLHIACTEGRGDVVSYIIKKKKDLIQELDTNGWTAAHCATTTSNRSAYIETCILLINGGADFSLATKSEGNTAFHYLTRQSIPEEISWTSITGSSTSAFPPGMISQNTEDSFVSILQYALEKGQGQIYSKNHLGEYPLHFSSMKTTVATKFLCDKGSKIDIRSKQGETALHYAVNVGSLPIIQFLLERGANKYITSESDETPLEMAKRLKRTDLVDVLADQKLPAIHTSIRNNKWNSVNMFVRAEQNILNNPDKNGLTPLLHAASIANREILLLLLTNNAIDATAADKFGNNVFHYLAVSMLMKKRATNEVKPSTLTDAEFLKTVLSRAGATTLTKPNKLGETALHNAALHGNVSLCKFLIENGASISAQNDLGETPLHYAVIGQKIETVKLIALDANLELLPNKKSETAFDYASKLRVEEALTILTPIHQAANDPKRKKKEKEDKKLKEKEKQEKEKQEKLEKEKLEKEKQEKEKQDKEKAKSPNETDKSEKRKKRERKQTKIFGNLKGLDISGPSQVVHAVHVNKELTWESNDPEEVFELERQVGSGAFGVVYKAIHKSTGIILAVKSLPAGDHPEEIRNEIAILQKCNDPNIVSYLGSMLKMPKLWILMEFCGCGSVSDLIKKMKEKEKRLTEGQVASICIAVVKGLMYLHSQKFIHRDLKPANILLNGSGEAKIAGKKIPAISAKFADFGVSAQLSHTIQQANTTIGTQSISGNKYDNKTDIWSLGITVIEMIECKLPFEGMNIMQAIGAIVNDPPPTLTNPGKYSPELNQFISECLTKDPAKRKSAFELLMHPFISNRLGQDQKQVLKELLREFYDVTSVDSSAVFTSAPKERTSSSYELKPTNKPSPTSSLVTAPINSSIKNERVEIVKSGESFLGSHKRFSSDSKVSSTLDDEEVLEEESPLSSPHLTAGKDDSLVETLRETVFDLKAQLEAERTKTMVFPKQENPDIERLQKELSESKAIQNKQLQEIETLKQQLISVTKSRDLLEETVKKLILQVSNLEEQVNK